MSNVWLIRANAHSPLEEQGFALRERCAVIGWGQLGDMSEYGDLDAVKVSVRAHNLYKADAIDIDKSIYYNAWQPWCFANTKNHDDLVKKGDWVVLPLMDERGNPVGHSAVGKVKGGYQYVEDVPNGSQHQRPVQKWEEIPNGDIPLHKKEFGNRLTVSHVNRAEVADELAALMGEGVQ